MWLRHEGSGLAAQMVLPVALQGCVQLSASQLVQLLLRPAERALRLWEAGNIWQPVWRPRAPHVQQEEGYLQPGLQTCQGRAHRGLLHPVGSEPHLYSADKLVVCAWFVPLGVSACELQVSCVRTLTSLGMLKTVSPFGQLLPARSRRSPCLSGDGRAISFSTLTPRRLAQARRSCSSETADAVAGSRHAVLARAV